MSTRTAILCACLGIMLAGCATATATAVDTYCLSARKQPWSINDDRETIKRAEIHNRTIDARCGYPGKKG